jgi:acyl carrier protein
VSAHLTTVSEIESWLAARIEFHLEKPPGSVDIDVDMTTYGLDSIYAFSLIVDIEQELGVGVEPEIARECRTVRALAALVTEMLGGAPEPAAMSTGTRKIPVDHVFAPGR